MNNIKNNPLWVNALSLFILLFGAMTLLEGGKALFTESGRIAAGAIVPFVLWFNFIAGFFYIVAGVAIFNLKSCAKKVSSVLAISSLIIFVLLIVHIVKGNPYETRTLIAMSLRTMIWLSISITVLKAKKFNSTACQC